MKFRDVAKYCETIYGIQYDRDEEFFICPECGSLSILKIGMAQERIGKLVLSVNLALWKEIMNNVLRREA